MGYDTNFEGHVTVEPPLNEHEISYLAEFAETRHMSRRNGPYYVDGQLGHGSEGDVIEPNRPDPEQPGLWCQWVPAFEGTAIEWDGNEKFYNAEDWMKYIVEHFLVDNAVLRQRLDSTVAGKNWFKNNGYVQDPRFDHFTFDHVVNGQIYAQGEDPGDRWAVVVENNVVKVAQAEITFTDPTPI